MAGAGASQAQAAPDAAACERLMRGGSKSFFAASLLLPRRARAPATALYAFCRVADDAVDLDPERECALERLNDRLDRIYAGRPLPIAADRALAGVVSAHGIPRALLDALLEGFCWDAQGRRYETIEELHAYGARVAGAVGAMMALILGARSRQALARACEMGVAMQLTNIARDVGEDAANGRLYLPLAWMREAGIDPDAWLQAPVFDHRLGSVVGRLLAEADGLYARSELGIAALPADCRAAIKAARLVYAEIGREVERAGMDSVSRRAVVSFGRKLWLMGRSLGAVVPRPGASSDSRSMEPLAAVRFLVDEAEAAEASAAVARARGFDERAGRVLELFARMAERDQAAQVYGRRSGMPFADGS
jgi:phytoene synthase